MLIAHPDSGLLLVTDSGLLAASLTCCCGASGVPPCDIGQWTHLEFFDQTGDCVCLPDTVILGSGASWTTSTCPGNLGYGLSCDEATGLPQLSVAGLGFAILLTNDPPIELIFQLPDLGVNCGPGGGTAKVRITP